MAIVTILLQRCQILNSAQFYQQRALCKVADKRTLFAALAFRPL
jgi:hypothetical protein